MSELAAMMRVGIQKRRDMFSAHSDSTGHVRRWVGDLDDQAAHDWILGWLYTDLGAQPDPTISALTNPIKGNLGEAIAAGVARTHRYPSLRMFPANAFHPLGKISKSELDIVWLHLASDPQDDFVVLQEVKTTSEASLSLGDQLVVDYKKLFGTDAQLTLHTRIGSIAAELRFKLDMPQHAQAIVRLTGVKPSTTIQTYLLPTLLHQPSASTTGLAKMISVRSSVVGLGWDPGVVECDSIELDALDSRLLRIAHGNR